METPQNSLNSALFAKTVLRWQGVDFGTLAKNVKAQKLMEMRRKYIRMNSHDDTGVSRNAMGLRGFA